MHCRVAITLGATVILSVAPSAILMAQSSPPTSQADPSVYKVIFENESFRVMAATWKAGQTDQPHSHPIPSVIYSLNDCILRIDTRRSSPWRMLPVRYQYQVVHYSPCRT
jgi:hypothetical protein